MTEWRFHRKSVSEETDSSDVGEMDGSTTAVFSIVPFASIKPFTAPVYQCLNGHAACSYCYVPQNSRQMSLLLYQNGRCLLFLNPPKLLAHTTSMAAQQSSVTMIKPRTSIHVLTPHFPALSTPACSFRGSRGNLHPHLVHQHEETIVSFRFNSVFRVSMAKHGRFPIAEDDLLILLERDGTPFFIKSENNTIRVGCFDGRFGFLSTYFFDSESVVKLGICIWNEDGDNPEFSSNLAGLRLISSYN